MNHIDGCKLNNHVSNLEWCTAAENIQHAFEAGLAPSGEARSQAKLTNEQVLEIRNNPDALNCEKLATKFGVSPSTIGEIQLGKTWQNVGGTIRTALSNHGEENANAKLTAADVEYIRDNPDKLKVYELAEKFGVHSMIISQIRHGKLWKHVGGKIRIEDGCARLTTEQVAEIFTNPEGLLQRELAAKFGVCRQTVSDIQCGRRWAKFTVQLPQSCVS